MSRKLDDNEETQLDKETQTMMVAFLGSIVEDQPGAAAAAAILDSLDGKDLATRLLLCSVMEKFADLLILLKEGGIIAQAMAQAKTAPFPTTPKPPVGFYH